MAKKLVDKEELKKLKQKSGGFVNEFKEFVLRGNVMDMAVGVIIGGAFSDIVTALTKDFINPLINGIGGAEIGGSIKIYGGQRLLYGDFITSVINFVIMAFVLFMLLKICNGIISMGKKKEEEKKEAPKKSDETVLLEEIRDLLKKQK
ncbi:MAG: large conductance mechanosensitive channel protein MscL [Bacilli bacterium]|nr:large conductance mechanosensitive channel protein MscL [Bacilli bacterium]